MAMISIASIRRQEFRKAAFEVLQSEGVSGTTLSKVADHLGVSKGILLHHFESKQHLLEHAMRYSESLVRTEVTTQLKQARSPIERLMAIIEANFSPKFFQYPVCHAWLSLCVEAPRVVQFARVQNICHARTHSNLKSALKHLCAPDELEEIITAIMTIIDGLWFRAGLSKDGVQRDEAVAELRTYVKLRLPNANLESLAPRISSHTTRPEVA